MSEYIPAGTETTKILGWAIEAMQEGEAFLRSQSGYDRIGETIDRIMGDHAGEPRPTALSGLSDNRFGKVAADMSALLTDTKPFWEYHTKNRFFEQQAQMLDKLSLSWWYNRLIDMKHSGTIKYAIAAGTGYAHHTYDADIGDLDWLPEDPRDVIPVRPASLESIQDSFAVLIRRERTVNFLKAKYPGMKILPDRDGSYLRRDRRTRAARLLTQLGYRTGFMANLMSSIGKPAAELRVPVADVFTLYVKDNSINHTNGVIRMGPWKLTAERGWVAQTNWAYEVRENEPIYPRRRTIVFTKGSPRPFYDGPNIYWHGLFPVAKLTLDPWPWSWLGKPPLHDLLPLQDALDRNMRVSDDVSEKFARPDITADKNAVSQSALNRLDSRRAGLKLRYNALAGRAGVQINYPTGFDFNALQARINDLRNEMDYLSGVGDLRQLAQLGQIPQAETVERILESMTPSIRARSRTMEAFLRESARMVMSNFFQFYTTAQRVAVLGPMGQTFEDFDYDPGTLIPDYVDDDIDGDGIPTAVALAHGPRTRADRARTFLRNFTFHVAPGSLLAASEVTRKMMYMQLARAGWVDIWTLGEILGIPNIGNPPEGANNIIQRLQAMQKLGLQMSVNPAGRKSSGQKSPRLVVKES